MKISLHIGQASYDVDLQEPLDISIPVRFEGGQVTAFGAAPARKEVYHAGDFTGDVRKGGSCNCEVYTFSPHLHGTHTEGIGHITAERLSVCDTLKDAIIPATLITVTPQENSDDTYTPPARKTDKIITKKSLESVLSGADRDFVSALVIRTRPNGSEKTARDYNTFQPPFFSNDAMKYIAGLGVKHLLVDFPSVDRPDDEGKLSNHRIFWDSADKTITELIFVPESVLDGHYLLNLQVAAMAGDAASSRPILFKVKKS